MLRSLRLSFAVLACCAATSVHAAASGLQLSERLQPASDPTITPVIAIPELHLKLSDRASASLVCEVVLRKALAMLGTDYEFGSNVDDAVDCSELVQQAFRSAGPDSPCHAIGRQPCRAGVAPYVAN